MDARFLVEPDAAPADPVGRALHALAAGVALAGGGVLLGIVAVTAASILGRNLLAAPVPGDVELVEMGAAVAGFAFLPYAQLTRAHAVVDVFTDRLPARARWTLEGAALWLLAGLAALLAWRMAVGAMELRGYGEETMVLGLPLWWGLAPASACLGLLALTSAWSGWRALARVRAP